VVLPGAVPPRVWGRWPGGAAESFDVPPGASEVEIGPGGATATRP
jgi:hypothetical protein